MAFYMWKPSEELWKKFSVSVSASFAHNSRVFRHPPGKSVMAKYRIPGMKNQRAHRIFDLQAYSTFLIPEPDKPIMRLILILLSIPALTIAQAPYTEVQYSWQVETDLVYGTATNYLGQTDTLTLDLYTPDSQDSSRPLLVLIHGGAWLSGCKEDMAWFCTEMASRGYTVATINYRKGWHKDNYVPNPANPAVFPGGNCLYPADSLEIIRAIYRGMQDAKGAIRWLKARVYAGPDCKRAVLVGGESAGAFLALATGLLDRPAEKPVACSAQPDAPTPGSNLSNCYATDCILQEYPVSAGALARPDLGPVEGELNLNGFDASVDGVISFFGGLPSEAFASEWLQGPDTPALYLYHQTCDGIVPFQYGKPFGVLSNYCNLGATPWHYEYPFVYGNGALAGYLNTLPAPPPYQTDFLTCNSFNPALALFECIRYNDNGSYHYPHNRPERAEKIAAFFSPVVSTLLAGPPCTSSTAEPAWASGIRPAPNPFTDQVMMQCNAVPDGPVQVAVLDARGSLLLEQRISLHTGNNPLPWNAGWAPGLYYVRLSGSDGTVLWKVVRL
ncbi:MAG: T9SS type A sorting domain-containing protein [Bacteroidetes bacterium]|nr:MAG: T9SS type A sorting domain-containing protein [Bacteroidota bacterium]